MPLKKRVRKRKRVILFTAMEINVTPEEARILAKKANLLRKMTMQERREAPRLTKAEREALKRVSERLQYEKERTTGNYSRPVATFALFVTVRLPKGCNTDAANDAADWLQSLAQYLMDKESKGSNVVEITAPRLVAANIVDK